MEGVKTEQIQGSQEKVKANKDKATEIPAIEKHLIHVRLQPRGVNQETREFEHAPTVQCFTVRDFEKMENDGAFKQYHSVTIVHDPRPAAQAAPKVAGGTGSKDPKDNAKKNLERMNLVELQGRYTDLYSEPPAAELDHNALRDAITEKLDFLAEEEKAGSAKK